MAEADYEQRMRELQRQYVDFLDDSDRDGVYDRSVIFTFKQACQFSYWKAFFVTVTNVTPCTQIGVRRQLQKCTLIYSYVFECFQYLYFL